MDVLTLAPGFYWTRPTSPGDSEDDRWEELDDAASLIQYKEDKSYGNCLSLSGGGYRAALFHLGVLRRLNEVGMLGYLDTITCVSGGSIIGAFLARTIHQHPGWWPSPGELIPPETWNEQFAKPFRKQTERDVRSVSVLTGGLPLGALSKGVETLEKQIAKHVNGGSLSTLPTEVNFLFCSSEMVRGDYWLFGRDHIGPHNGPFKFVLPDYPIARAVAASACFPPVFDPQETDFWSLIESLPPLVIHEDEGAPALPALDEEGYPLTLEPLQMHPMPPESVPKHVREYLKTVRLTDGGVFDNNAIEATWSKAGRIIVSDAGGPFQVSWASKLFWRLKRYQGITSKVASSNQFRWLSAQYWLGDLPSIVVSIKSYDYDYDYDVLGDRLPQVTKRYPLVLRRLIAQIRTDMDAFTHPEGAILENHGYWETDRAIRRIGWESAIPEGSRHRNVPRWVAITPRWDASSQAPWPEYMDPEKVRNGLKESHKTKVQGHKGWWAFLKARIDVST